MRDGRPSLSRSNFLTPFLKHSMSIFHFATLQYEQYYPRNPPDIRRHGCCMRPMDWAPSGLPPMRESDGRPCELRAATHARLGLPPLRAAGCRPCEPRTTLLTDGRHPTNACADAPPMRRRPIDESHPRRRTDEFVKVKFPRYAGTLFSIEAFAPRTVLSEHPS